MAAKRGEAQVMCELMITKVKLQKTETGPCYGNQRDKGYKDKKEGI
jgi:hypothetical protein